MSEIKINKIIENHKATLLIGVTFVFLFLIGLVFISKFNVLAQGQKKFFSFFNVNNSSASDGWQNVNAAATQDLNSQADFSEFNINNSAYILGTKEFSNSVDSASTTTAETSAVDATTTESVNNNSVTDQVNPQFQSQVLELSGFGLSADEADAGIQNTKLSLSLAGQGQAGDDLMVDYYYHDQWHNLAKLDLSQPISNYSNGGYFYYPLTLLSNLQDFSDLKIRLTYHGQGAEKIYLDGLWLDMEMRTIPATDISSADEASSTAEISDQPEASSTVPVSENEEILNLPATSSVATSSSDNKLVVFPKEENQINTSTKTIPEVPILNQIRKTPKKFFKFSLVDRALKSTKKLDWYSSEVKVEQDNLNNDKINIKVISPDPLSTNKKPKLIFSGSCQKKYFVVLAFSRPDDYVNDPGKFVYNKAFLCQNGSYYYELTDLSENLKAGTYYFMIAEQGESGPWQPVSAIQSVNINSTEE